MLKKAFPGLAENRLLKLFLLLWWPRTLVLRERTHMLPLCHPSTSTLLCVEDDADARLLFEMAVNAAKAQFHFRFAEGVNEAKAYLTGEADYADRQRFPLPDAILLDFTLGADSALDLLYWMDQTECAQTEVAIFSASDAESQIKQSYAAGADYYLVKPTHYPRLVELVSIIDCCFHANSRQRLFRVVTLPEFRRSMHDPAVA
jgi:DNA-binding response OmpR family regulator